MVLGERHLVRLARSYINYYHKDRCHLGLMCTSVSRLRTTSLKKTVDRSRVHAYCFEYNSDAAGQHSPVNA